jgi:hypothetical protein
MNVTFFTVPQICAYKQNKGLFVSDTVFIRTIIWLTLSGSPDNGPDKDSIENKMPFILYLWS